MSNKKALKAIALFEAAKGLLALAAGFGLISLMHQNIQSLANDLIRYLHIDRHPPIVEFLLDRIDRINSTQMIEFAILAAIYASIRMVEAYGLWMERRWAEVLAVLSGLIYLPLEISELIKGISLIKLGVIAINLGVVIYMCLELWRSRKLDIE